jgi:ribose transport system ATP-binding protein
MTASAPLLEMRGIGKRFVGVVALRGVSLTLRAGEVLALMGENGAGKSTLTKVLAGVHRPDTGEIRIDGKPVLLNGVRDAKRLGIALIHQELMLASNLDIAANLFLGNELAALDAASQGRSASVPLWRWLAPLPGRRIRELSERLLERVGLRLPAATPVSRLTAGQMQLCEIAKALGQRARILIMDEPTSSLTAAESEQLFRIIAQLKAEGMGIIYISHRMDEVLALADRVTVLRDAQHVGDLARAEASRDAIVRLMVGRQLSQQYFPARAPQSQGGVALEARDLLVPGAPSGVSFRAQRGEILGFAGLVGSGRTELVQAIFGATPALSGSLRLEARDFRPLTPRAAIERGVFLAPEDRKKHGLVLPMSVAENTSLPGIGSYARFGWLDRKRERQVAEREMKRLNTRASGPAQRVVNLSGGNQQKVVLGKWLALAPRVLILDEPTRGIDVGAKAEIYRHMAALAEAGVCILMVSSDMEEILGMSDRVVVMHERRIVAELGRAELSQARLAHLMTGGSADSEAAA